MFFREQNPVFSTVLRVICDTLTLAFSKIISFFVFEPQKNILFVVFAQKKNPICPFFCILGHSKVLFYAYSTKILPPINSLKIELLAIISSFSIVLKNLKKPRSRIASPYSVSSGLICSNNL